MLIALRSRIGEALRKLGRFKLLFILLPYIFLISLASYFAYQRCIPTFIKDGVKYTRSICGNIKSAEALPTKRDPNEKLVNAKVYTNEKANYWEIVDTSKSPQYPTGLKIYEKDLPSPIVRRNNLLLGLNIEHYVNKSSGGFLDNRATEHYTLQKQIRSIRVYNIDTGESYDISLEKPIYGEVWYETSQVLDNTYFFGVGGAFGASLGYKLDLPPSRTSRITKLTTSLGNDIKKVGNTYISSSCYEGCTYSLFNPVSFSTTPLQRMNDASNGYMNNRKEEFIGIDSQGRMIVNVRNIPKDSNNQEHFDTEELIAVPLNNEKTTISLLKANEIPEKMQSYIMIDGVDKILMLGATKLYIYDVVQGKLHEVQTGADVNSILSKANQFPPSRTDRAICFTDSKNISFAIDLTTETYLDKAPNNCKSSYSSPTASEVAQDVFKGLNLPDNFELIYTPTEYRTYNTIKGIPESELPKGAEIVK